MSPALLLDAFFALALPAAPKAPPPPVFFERREVAPGVHAFLKPRAERFDDSNSLLIETDGGLILVDCQADPLAARALAQEVRRLSAKPLRFIVYTHWHGDHTQTSGLYRALFPGPIDFIAHSSLAEDVPTRSEEQRRQMMERLRGQLVETTLALPVDEPPKEAPAPAGDPAADFDPNRRVMQAASRLADLGRFGVVPPTLTFEGELTLRFPGRTVRLLHFPGHTRGDVVVHLPEDRVLASGDLVDDLPYGGHGVPSRWLASLERLEGLDFEVLVPGHGRIRRGKDHLRLVRRLVESIRAQVGRAVAAGQGLEETQAAIDLGEFRRALVTDEPSEGAFPEFMAAAVERAWREARGELLE